MTGETQTVGSGAPTHGFRPLSVAGPDPAAAVAEWVAPSVGAAFVWISVVRLWVGRFPVTNGEYRKLVPEHYSGEADGVSLDGDRQPAVYVSYEDAVRVADLLSEREREAGRLAAGLVYRLPTGDEWTGFAQCGDGRMFPWGNDWPPRWGNYRGRAGDGKPRVNDDDEPARVCCVVEKSGRNEWGLFGGGGNVWEWTSEAHGEYRALRGASWVGHDREVLACGYRFFSRPDYRYNHAGFRLVLGPPIMEA
jgi:formylglycine-generating enzyme required for sulfatase activity